MKMSRIKGHTPYSIEAVNLVITHASKGTTRPTYVVRVRVIGPSGRSSCAYMSEPNRSFAAARLEALTKLFMGGEI